MPSDSASGSWSSDECAKRSELIAIALKMNATGLNHGTSGNLSVRYEAGLLITPSGRPYDTMQPQDITFLDLDGKAEGLWPPSSEWRFHRDIMAARPDVRAVLHAHPDYATSLAIHGREIPAVHYMIAVFGGPTIRCAPYAIYGSQELSDFALKALEGRNGCLLAHHGIITAGRDLQHAYWLAWELETLAKQYHLARALGEPPLLSDQQVQEVIEKAANYGLPEHEQS